MIVPLQRHPSQKLAVCVLSASVRLSILMFCSPLTRFCRIFRWVAGYSILLMQSSLSIAEDSVHFSESELIFVRRITPLLNEKCLACHGNETEKVEGGLSLSTLDQALHGGDSAAPALVPGEIAKSSIYLAATRQHAEWSPMPPKEADKLSAEQLAWLQRWIETGGEWPDKQRQAIIVAAFDEAWSAEDGVEVATSGGLSESWTKRKYRPEALWAYQPVMKPNVAKNGSAAIDELIALKLPSGLPNAPRGDARTLIRRATFDLTGLPPTPADVEQFVVESESNPQSAFAQLIDRLLESPHYGERMAQHWLDVVRYADSSGFANDFERGNAWRYRDYVIRAFNDDKPFDQFIREQIAGDEIDPNNSEMLIATGFLRMGPWELTGMEVAKVARQRFLDDVTNSVGETFLAHSLQCARCHDHKFDPIPTRDYYAMQAVFSTTQLAERSAPFLNEENTTGFDERKYLELAMHQHQSTLKELDEVLLANAQSWYQQTGKDSTIWDKTVVEVQNELRSGQKQDPITTRRTEVFDAARNRLAKQGVPESDYPPKLVGFTPQQFGIERISRKGIERLRWELERYEPYALSVYNGATPNVKSVFAPTRIPKDRFTKGELEQTCILSGGDPFSPTEKVDPGSLSALQSLLTDTIPTSVEGRRLALASWIANDRNPLTTRTIVNRIWLWHFGQALAGNPNNFGSTGKKPTHPELLDWLAATFVENGWSIKKLHRLIMLSEVYQRSANHPDGNILREKDPLQQSYSVFVPRRLSAEEIRDATLAVSGELNTQLGGIPVRPEINLEAALQPRQVMGTFAAAWVPNPDPVQRHRRSMYTLKLRGLIDPTLEVFNAPAPDFSSEKRESSTISPQAFAMLNSQSSYKRAIAMARRVMREASTDEDAVARAIALAYGRPVVEKELQLCMTHWKEMASVRAHTRIELPRPPMSVQRDAVEENTGEKFSFEEELYANRDYQPDFEIEDCDSKVLGLAELCLVLLNSNEFIYVY